MKAKCSRCKKKKEVHKVAWFRLCRDCFNELKDKINPAYSRRLINQSSLLRCYNTLKVLKLSQCQKITKAHLSEHIRIPSDVLASFGTTSLEYS